MVSTTWKAGTIFASLGVEKTNSGLRTYEEINLSPKLLTGLTRLASAHSKSLQNFDCGSVMSMGVARARRLTRRWWLFMVPLQGMYPFDFFASLGTGNADALLLLDLLAGLATELAPAALDVGSASLERPATPFAMASALGTAGCVGHW
jgi:hypothetical protein